LGYLYADRGKLGEAEQMYERVLRSYEEALGSDRVQQYRPALNALENMGDGYMLQAAIPKAQAMYVRAISGLSSVYKARHHYMLNLLFSFTSRSDEVG
jgi:tetratricopeptide (TPR) repeat protein